LADWGGTVFTRRLKRGSIPVGPTKENKDGQDQCRRAPSSRLRHRREDPRLRRHPPLGHPDEGREGQGRGGCPQDGP